MDAAAPSRSSSSPTNLDDFTALFALAAHDVSPLDRALVLTNCSEVTLFCVPPELAPLIIRSTSRRLECVSVQGAQLQQVLRAIVDAQQNRLPFRLCARDAELPDASESSLLVLADVLSRSSPDSAADVFASVHPMLVIDSPACYALCQSRFPEAAIKVLAETARLVAFLLDDRSRPLKHSSVAEVSAPPDKVHRYATEQPSSPPTQKVRVQVMLSPASAALDVDCSKPGWGARLEALVTPGKSAAAISAAQALQTAHTIGRLKRVQRTGWVLRGIERPESVAEHSYRMAMMALLFAGDRDVDASRASCMALVHDLAEAIVGDIAPSQGVSPENKMRLEREAMQSIVQTLGDNPAARLISGLWEEYEARLTPEARLVKDLDRLEMVLQADEYETAHGLDLSEFFHSVAGKIRHPAVAAWFDALEKKRKV